PIRPVALLRTTKVGSASVTPGTNVSYVVQVSNLGPSVAAQVVVDDPAPIGLTLVQVTGACTALPCSLGDLQPGDSRSVGVVFAVPPAYPGPNPIINIAIPSSPTISTLDDGNPARADTSDTASADLPLTEPVPPAARP